MPFGMKAAALDVQARRTLVLAQDFRAVLSKLKRRMREQGHGRDLTPSQTSVLLRLEKDGAATASSLARAEGMRPQSIVPIIAALESARLVRGKPDPKDGRQTLLSLTEACRISMAQGRAAKEDWFTRMLEARFTAAEQDKLVEAVTLLRRLVDD